MFPRRFLELELRETRSTGLEGVGLPNDIVLAGWTTNDYNDAAELIHRAYAGHIDAMVNDQYRSLHGSLRFLHNIVRFPGCGIFDANASWTLRER